MRSKLSKILVLCMAVLFMLTVIGCGGKGEDQTSGMKADERPAANQPSVDTGKDVLVFSALGVENAQTMAEQFAPLLDYLSGKLGKKVELKLCSSYTEVIDGIGTGSIDFAELGPNPYIKAHDKYGVECIVKPLESGVPSYKAVLVVKKDSPIRSAADLKGKNVGFGDAESTGSHFVPRFILLENGIDVDKDLKGHKFWGSHDNVAKAVLAGECDAGGLKEAVFEKYKDQAPGLRAIAVSEPIASIPYAVRKDMDPQLKEQIKQAFLDLKDPEIFKKMDKKFNGYVEATDADYDYLRRVSEKLQMD